MTTPSLSSSLGGKGGGRGAASAGDGKRRGRAVSSVEVGAVVLLFFVMIIFLAIRKAGCPSPIYVLSNAKGVRARNLY